jgi:hypothetical protein
VISKIFEDGEVKVYERWRYQLHTIRGTSQGICAKCRELDFGKGRVVLSNRTGVEEGKLDSTIVMPYLNPNVQFYQECGFYGQ